VCDQRAQSLHKVKQLEVDPAISQSKVYIKYYIKDRLQEINFKGN